MGKASAGRFTDIVGYAALMGKDEDAAFRLLHKNRDIQRSSIIKFRGELLKEIGDGILASFHTSSDAVQCAGEIQSLERMEGIGLRIGVHEGEVVFEGGDVLGDGVNVASRLEELEKKGAINISGAVYKDIKNKSGISTDVLEKKIKPLIMWNQPPEMFLLIILFFQNMIPFLNTCEGKNGSKNS